MASFRVQGASLECAELGEGARAGFVHGSASDHRRWLGRQQEFAKRHRVLTHGRRLHWPDEPIGEGADDSMRQQLDGLEAVPRARGQGSVPA